MPLLASKGLSRGGLDVVVAQMRLFSLLAVAALLSLAGTTAAQEPTPGILAQASADPTVGAIVVWTVLPGIDPAGFEISRSRAGSAFVAVGTAAAGATAFTDVDGQASDVYMVTASVAGGADVSSNPAPAIPMLGIHCPVLEFLPVFPFIELHPECIWAQGPSAELASNSPTMSDEQLFGAGMTVPGFAW